jgi:hypothetical protein
MANAEIHHQAQHNLKSLVFIILIDIPFLLIPSVASATTYYVSASGSSGSNGKSPAAAWRYVSDVNGHDFMSGDSILFNRGNVWRECLIVHNSGAAGNQIVFGAYGKGAKPKLLQSVSKSSTSDWTKVSSNIWKTTGKISTGFTGARGDAENVWFNNNTSWGVLKLTHGELTSQGDFWTDSGDTLYLYSTSNPGSFYAEIEVGLTVEGTYDGLIDCNNNSHLVVQNFDIVHGTVYLGGGSACDVTIEYCDQSYTGGARYPDRDGSSRFGGGMWMWSGGTDMTVCYCKIWQQYDGCLTLQGSGSGATWKRIRFHHNVLYNSHYIFELWTRGSIDADSVFVENNTCVNAGGWGSAANQRPGDTEHHGDNILEFHQSTAHWTHFYIRNNIFYQTQNGHVVYMPVDGGEAATNGIFDYNLYYQPSGTMVMWYIGGDHNYSQAEWGTYRRATGKEANSPTPANPNFVSSTDYHLTPASTSAIGTGTTVGYTHDIDGNTITKSPDLGAY